VRSAGVGQSLTETLVLTAATVIGVIGILALCGERITKFIDLVLTIIANPVP